MTPPSEESLAKAIEITKDAMEERMRRGGISLQPLNKIIPVFIARALDEAKAGPTAPTWEDFRRDAYEMSEAGEIDDVGSYLQGATEYKARMFARRDPQPAEVPK